MLDENGLSDITAASMDWNIRDELKGLTLDEIRKEQPDWKFSVCLINTTGSLNIGVAIRSAVLFGASKFYIAGRRKYDKRSTVGAQNYIDVDRIDCIDDSGAFDSGKLIQKIEIDGFNPVIIEQGGNNISDLSVGKHLHPCMIFGEEKDGIPQSLLDRGFPIYSIETVGVLRSLNVSVAASIAMYEYTRG